LDGIGAAAGGEPLIFDRSTGHLDGASLVNRAVLLALQAGSVITQPFGHRGYRLGCRTLASIAAKRDIIIRLNENAVLAIPFCDGYWSRLLNRRYHYEEEIEALLRCLANDRYFFIDCGANFGYWSVLTSSLPFGTQPTLAVEASRTNALRLAENARLNGSRFRFLNAAMSGSSGFARVVGNRHEKFETIALEQGEPGAVERITLDAVAAQSLTDPSFPVLVKLDVEGVEIEVLEGGRTLSKRDTLFICEEHGSDRAHNVSRYLLGHMEQRLYAFDPVEGRFIRLVGPDQLDRLKKHSWVGYNVFATSSSLWEARLRSVRWRP